MKKQTKVLVSITIATLFVLSFAFAITEGIINGNWFSVGTPSSQLSPTVTTNLVDSNYSKWTSDSYWYDKGCYYYNLNIGYEQTIWNNDTKQYEDYFNITWSDANRELKCNTPRLSDATVNELELDNVAWTLDQLGGQIAQPDNITPVSAVKGEDLSSGTLIDSSGTSLNAGTLQPVLTG